VQSKSLLKKSTLSLSLILGFAFLSGTAGAAEMWVTEGFQNPESVLLDAPRNVFYVSNVNGDPVDKDGAGHISRLSTDGTMLEAEWVDGLNAPKGMSMRGNLLYVSDIDQLVAIDVLSGTIAGSWTGTGAQFLNDVAIGNDGRVFVSDMLTDSIYVLDGNNFLLWLQSEELQHPNGLRIEGDQLLIAAWGKDLQPDFSTTTPGHLLAVNLASKAISSVGSGAPVGNLDGLEPDGQGNYLVTDWLAGTLYRISADGSTETLLDLNMGSADLEFVANGALAVIPMMNDNTVAAYSTR
jgi:outer membrane protein assembly factor BamB